MIDCLARKIGLIECTRRLHWPTRHESDTELHINLRTPQFFVSVARRRIFVALVLFLGCRRGVSYKCILRFGWYRKKEEYTFVSVSMCRIIYFEERKRERQSDERIRLVRTRFVRVRVVERKKRRKKQSKEEFEGLFSCQVSFVANDDVRFFALRNCER